MIIGIGSDLLKQDRIKRIFIKFPHLLVKKLLHNDEHVSFENMDNINQVKFLAKKFSVTEAFSKALGTGIGAYCNFRDLILKNNEHGKPILSITGSTKQYLKTLNAHVKIHITFSDETIKDEILVLSTVILEA
ncbi:MAG: holo-ACP synthase [Alphaproteobacteria bacterium]|nr:MAG: holo-ACP synthase [Alphaproteobacteria bacterium]